MYAVKNSPFVLFLLGLLLLGTTACDDVIAKDISEETPVVVLPISGATIDANPVHIKWNELKGATRYRIEIVSPSFASISEYTIDSTVTGTNFFVSLDSNDYELRITALNAGYTSKTSAIIPFSVGASAGGGNTSVVLTAPASNAYVNSDNVTFSWNSVPNLQSYTFELHSGPTFASPTVYSEDQLASVQLALTDLEEGTYSWGVKAFLTDGSETAFTKRVFYIDTTNPGPVTLTSPTNNAIVPNTTVSFSWNYTNPGTVQSTVNSTIEIARDNQFTDIAHTQTVTGTSVSVTLTDDVYFWRIKTVDEAGNAGPTSSVYTFTLFP